MQSRQFSTKLVNSTTTAAIKSPATSSIRGRHHAESIYVKKVIPGGILLFELGVCEPFVYMKIYAFPYNSLFNQNMMDSESSRKSLINKIGEVNWKLSKQRFILPVGLSVFLIGSDFAYTLEEIKDYTIALFME